MLKKHLKDFSRGCYKTKDMTENKTKTMTGTNEIKKPDNR